ncbi:glycosyltransferase [Lacticaseibacillus kribbianus]|uniref:glycosyltransferase n=1 Tax=Lacticaseibacillus kribbianus TaxID=2926292 RepID=UPI001CD3C7D9|nr:glycosyltransferase family 2 protein [Lacticaseibacillus kribbianus]
MLETVNTIVIVMSAFGLIRIFISYWTANVYDLRAINRTRGTPPPTPGITVVVPAYNEEVAIATTLASVVASDYPNMKIIVVDDGSSDRTSEVVTAFMQDHPDAPVELVRQANGGKSVAINRALFKHVQTELMMVLDADSLLATDAVRNMVAWFADPRTLAMAMQVKMLRLRSALGLCQRFEFLSAYRGKCAEHVLRTLYIIGGIGSTFRVAELRAIGGYDTDTPTEDIDLTMKLLSVYGNTKHTIGYAHDAVAYTQPVTKFTSLVKQRFRWKYGRFVAFMKYRHLFFSRNAKHARFLTFGQLPMAVFQELFMLIEPFVYLYLVGVVLVFGDWLLLFAMVGYVVAVIGLSVTTSGEPPAEQLRLMLTAPLNFALAFTLTIVEYVSLIKAMVKAKDIINYQNNHASWDHVERL